MDALGEANNKCRKGGSVQFECPCCPEEFEQCRFKKLLQEGYIVKDGILRNQMNKYEVDEHKTQITLKSCDEEDGGVYVWICGKCNINKQFTLEVFEDSWCCIENLYIFNIKYIIKH